MLHFDSETCPYTLCGARCGPDDGRAKDWRSVGCEHCLRLKGDQTHLLRLMVKKEVEDQRRQQWSDELRSRERANPYTPTPLHGVTSEVYYDRNGAAYRRRLFW